MAVASNDPRAHGRYGFSDSMKNNIEAKWATTLESENVIYPSVFKVKSMDEADFRFKNIPGLTLPTDRPEFGDSPVDSTRENYTVTIYPVFQAKTLEFSEEFQQDDQMGNVMDITENAAQMMLQGKEAAACDVFNNAKTVLSSGRFQSGGDKRALLSTTHPLAGGAGNASNTSAMYKDPSHDALIATLNQMRANVNDKGVPQPLMPKKLICGTSTYLKWQKILGSDKVDDNGDNGINVIPGQGLKANNVVEMYYIENQRFWAIQTNFKEDKGLVFFDRMDTRLMEDYEVRRWVHVYVYGNRFAVAFIDWRCLFGQA